MSKSTIVSLVPFDIHENKPVFPGDFFIPGARENDFEILVVDNATSFKYIDENRGTIKLLVESEELAKAIVEDYENSQVARHDGLGPGIFFVPGEYTKDGIRLKFKAELKVARDKQNKWFESLIRLADDDWEKTRQHRAISDLQRYAAKALNLERPWLIEPKMSKCPACKVTVEEGAIICSNCHAVLDKEAYEKMQFAKV